MSQEKTPVIVATEDIKVGETYEICDPVVGRSDPLYATVLKDLGNEFLVRSAASGQEFPVTKVCDFYELEEVDYSPEDMEVEA